MTTLHHRPTSTAGWNKALNTLGTVLVALPLGGVVGLLAALGGRFGGQGNALTAAWYVPAAMAAVAVLGAVILLLVHRHDSALKPLALWTLLSAAGWVFAMGSAQVTGLAESEAIENATLVKGLVLLGIAVYLVGLVGLTADGVRAGRPPQDDWY
jgi:hypothetical protein